MKRQLTKWAFIAFAAIVLSTLYGCNGCNGGGGGESMGKDTIDSPPLVTISDARLYMDNSASMKGYTGDMGYINTITQLWRAYPNTKVLKCGEGYASLDPAKGDVVDQLKNLAYGGSSLIHNDLKQILAQVNDSNIAYYVTDGILSGEAADIQANRKWTLEHAADIKLQIKEMFSQRKDVSISVYQFPANFKGEYWCYNNSDHKTIDTQRFYYAFVIGKASSVLDFKDKFVGTEYFKPKGVLHFIGQMPLGDSRHDIYSLDAPGDKFILKDLGNKNEGKMEICVKTTALERCLSKEEIKELALKLEVTANGKSQQVVAIYDEGNNCFKFAVEPRTIGGQKIDLSVSIPYSLPAWVMMSSCNDTMNGDLYMKDVNQQDSKTFLLLHLIDGIKQGLLGDTELLFNVTKTFERIED